MTGPVPPVSPEEYDELATRISDETLWCVECSIDPRDPVGRTTKIPAHDRRHADHLAAKLGGVPVVWDEGPELHAAMVRGIDRLLGEPKALDTDRWLASRDRAANEDPA